MGFVILLILIIYAHSAASPLVSPRTPALLAAKAVVFTDRLPLTASMEETLMMQGEGSGPGFASVSADEKLTLSVEVLSFDESCILINDLDRINAAVRVPPTCMLICSISASTRRSLPPK